MTSRIYKEWRKNKKILGILGILGKYGKICIVASKNIGYLY